MAQESKKAKRDYDTVLARELMGKIKQCPVTSGRPTAMTKAAFEAACNRCREQDRRNLWHDSHYKHNWCDTCQGKRHPKELRIVPLNRLMAERVALQGGTPCR